MEYPLKSVKLKLGKSSRLLLGAPKLNSPSRPTQKQTLEHCAVQADYYN